MFTGIIEAIGTIKNKEKEGTNVHFTIQFPISKELKIDQSIAHNGVCLTVVAQQQDEHIVTAVEETLKRSNLGELTIGAQVNLERAMASNGRLDGHIVQGHVDTTGKCVEVKEIDGSWYFTFEYRPNETHLLVDKGSVCINGISLTVVEPKGDLFSVAIIPYTYEHTNFNAFSPGTTVNLEFDIIGKYIAQYVKLYAQSGALNPS